MSFTYTNEEELKKREYAGFLLFNRSEDRGWSGEDVYSYYNYKDEINPSTESETEPLLEKEDTIY